MMPSQCCDRPLRSILDPGQCPSIHAVTRHVPDNPSFPLPTDLIGRFPAQEVIAGASKVPTVVYYDKEGSVKAIGAEAIKDGIFERAIEGDWYKAEWYAFSCHVHYSPIDGTSSGSSFI